MANRVIKIFDDLECFEMRCDGVFSYDREKDGRTYSGTGIIFEDRILYRVSFFRKRLKNSQYSDVPTDISGSLDFNGKTYNLIEVIMDKNADEFLFTFANGDEIIKLDCDKSDFKFCCDYLSR